MPLSRRKNFILIAEIASRQVEMIIEGLTEQTLTKKQIEDTDAIMLRKTTALAKQFPGNT